MSNYIKGAHHINIRPDHESYDATIHLYCQDLGLEMTNYWEKDRNGFISRNCFVDCGDGVVLEICECEKGTHDAGVVQHFALEVYNAMETLEMLKEKGYTIVNSKGLPTDQLMLDIVMGNPVMHLNLGFIKGPAGEIIEFVQHIED